MALGHAAAVAVVVAAAALAGLVVPLDTLRVAVASMLVMLGLYRLWRHRHPRYGGMKVGFRDLTAWSFLMASAHGAGFMVLPFVPAHHTCAPATVAGAGFMAVAVHTLAYFAVMALAAWVVYRKVGLHVLRRAWLNLDWVWAGALVITGLVVLLK
jgi:hypothetical protein